MRALDHQNQADRVGQSFREFVREFSDEPEPAWHHELLIDKLQAVADGEIQNLMVFMPPGSAKSTYGSVLFDAWWVQRNPNKLIIGASHAQELAEHFARKVRNIVGDIEYSDLFEVELSADSRSVGRWEATNSASYYAVGTGGSVTGRRADLGKMDDPVKGREEADSERGMEKLWEWYKSDFSTRLKPGASQILIQTRWVENDIAGMLLPEDYDGRSGPVLCRDGKTWYVVNLPMEAIEGDILGREPGELLWPDWFDHEWVAQTKKMQGPRNWNALYQQNPTPDEGTLFKRDDINWYPKRPKHLTYYMTGDYAVTEDDGDFTEMLVWGVDPKDEIYLVDGFRGQINSLEIAEQFCDFVEQYEPTCHIGESGVIRRAIEPLLRKRMRERKAFTRMEWLPTTGDKVAMSRGFQAMTQIGVIHFPVKDWAEKLLSQLIKFPGGRYDDGVDACGLLGRYMDKIWKANKPEGKPKALKVEGKPRLSLGAPMIADFMGDDDEE